jgi:hypothetical protein
MPEPGSGSRIILHSDFDPDGDTDPDTDAWGEGEHPGSSSFLRVSDWHVADGGLLGIDAGLGTA